MAKYDHMYTLFIFMLYFHMVLSQLPTNQVNTMNTIHQILQNNTGPSFVWSNNNNNNSSPCSWRGVSCSLGNTSITSLSFQLFSISSSDFLPFVCQLDSLVSLDVSNNHLSLIPDQFYATCGDIVGLRHLNFSRNRLSGVLPSFRGFRVLESLDLSHNLITGEVGLQLDGLDSLRSLNLSHNGFTGSVPINLGRSNLLEQLQLSFNLFSGEIPLNLTRYRNLTLIDLSLNRLSGLVPEQLGELTRLETLVLSLNRLGGGIPRSLSNVTTLSRFAANQNNLNGTIPAGISSYLRNLDLSYNRLTGVIPFGLLSGPNLQSIDLTNNGLEGSVPENISTRLFRLRLGNNSFSGLLPAGSLGRLVPLTYLELDGNFFEGSIPSELGMCTNLALLNLAQNRFTGPLPPALGGLMNLQVLSLQFNNFVGEIPAEFTMMNRLQKLNISMNSLNGSIPLSISNLTSLQNLDLQGNNLSGPLPDSIGSLSSLIELQLGSNQLIGPIPALPPTLQIALNLSYNLFSGPIPSTLSRLTQLEVLDISNNRFSGNIPNFLTGMTTLTHLILSNNQLSGIVPSFGNYVIVDTNGNTGLIFPSQNPTPPTQRRRRSLASVIAIAAAAAAVAVGLLILIAVFVSRRYYFRVNDEHVHSESETSPPQVIHGNLLTQHSIHRSNIDFRKAMEAVSDPLNVALKTRFSTYYKAVMPSGASYFVKKLNWSDKIFQSGSHERFEEELEILGKLSNSNVMIPLAYVLTTDSTYLFYDFAPKGTLFDVLHGSIRNTLDWANRYSIAIGVAQGLAFLHGSKSGSILLLDFSSRTITLKSLNEPQIGDIELCKVIDPSKSTASLSAVAGSVGYIPPEYAYTMRITAAGNVYSYGVILLELLTGKPAVSGGIELAKWVLSNSARENSWDQILDFNVSKTSDAVRSQMLAVLKLALACVSISPDSRPNMKSVLRMLLNAR